MTAKRSKKIQKRVEERTLQGLCLHRDESGVECCEQAESNGLCRSHLNEMYYERSRLGSDRAVTRYIANLVGRGLMLLPYERSRIIKRNRSPFGRAAVASKEPGR